MKFLKFFIKHNNIFYAIIFGSSTNFWSPTTDEQDFFVSGNRVNESLERVNLLLCYGKHQTCRIRK